MFHGHLVLVLKAVSRKVMRVLFALGFCLWVLVCLFGLPCFGDFLGFFPLSKRKQIVIVKRFGKLEGPSSRHLRAYSFSLEPEVLGN